MLRAGPAEAQLAALDALEDELHRPRRGAERELEDFALCEDVGAEALRRAELQYRWQRDARTALCANMLNSSLMKPVKRFPSAPCSRLGCRISGTPDAVSPMPTPQSGIGAAAHAALDPCVATKVRGALAGA